jgi:excisionase family DNA binding protein
VARESAPLSPALSKDRPRRAKRVSVPHDALPERLLNVHEAAALLGIAPGTLYNWAYERRIPKVKLYGTRGALRFRASDVQRLIAASLQPALHPTPHGHDQDSTHDG